MPNKSAIWSKKRQRLVEDITSDRNFIKCLVLNPREMAIAESEAVAKKVVNSSFELMERAGKAVAEAAESLLKPGDAVAILCGTGNNGGDGYIAAKNLASAGYNVTCFAETKPNPQKDAAKAAIGWNGKTLDLTQFWPANFNLLIDAWLGAGLDRPISDQFAKIVDLVNASTTPLLAVDLPSGVSGEDGAIQGVAFQATLTVTFLRKKVGHLLFPGRAKCGKVWVADIGIPATLLENTCGTTLHNEPDLWLKKLPHLSFDSYKYQRGHVAVFSGPRHSTGASRLAAWAAARCGAGAVTLIVDDDALDIHAAHLTSIMLHKKHSVDNTLAFLQERKVRASVIGPAFGDFSDARNLCHEIIESEILDAIVIDADAITAYAEQADLLFNLSRKSKTAIILTPHEGEFATLFPDLAAMTHLSRLEKAKKAASRANATLVYKGADTVIASASGLAAINSNGSPYLATAGSGDVLSGMIAGLVAQKMDPFSASCAAVWMHGQAAHLFGCGLIAEDIIGMLPEVLSQLSEMEEV